jgi:hypothetical protein
MPDIEIVATDTFSEWYQNLDDRDAEAVTRSVTLLEQLGTTLGYPHSSEIKGSQFAMRELRVQSGGRPIRVLYAFDPKRQAVLLIAADKTGDDRFYDWIVPKADEIFRNYLDGD